MELIVTRSGPNDFFGIVCLIGVAFFVIYLLFFTDSGNVIRKLRRTKAIDFSNLKHGEVVKATGKVVVAGKTLRSPLSGRTCVYWRLRVEGIGRNGAVVLIDDEEYGDVLLKNNETYILVETKIVKAYTVNDRYLKKSNGVMPHHSLIKFLNKHGFTENEPMTYKRFMEFFECVVEENEEVTVVGVAEWIDTSETSFGLPVKKLLRIKADYHDFVALSDDSDMLKK